MNLIRNLFLCLISVLTLANAGNESHGGDIVICQGKDPVVLDYYHASLKGIGEEKANIEDITNWSRERVVLFFRNSLKTYLFRFEMENALMKLGDFNNWIEADLKEVDDSNEPYFLPKNCERKQGAVRQGGQVFVDPTYVKQLSPAQQGILIIHEAIFYVANLHGIQNSIGVRQLIRTLLRKDSTPTDLVNGIHELKGLAYAFEVLKGVLPSHHSYQSACGSAEPALFFDRISAHSRTLIVRPTWMGALTHNSPAMMTCDNTGLICEIIEASNHPSSVLKNVGMKMQIRDGGRQLVFHPESSENPCIFWGHDSPNWPFPIGNSK